MKRLTLALTALLVGCAPALNGALEGATGPDPATLRQEPGAVVFTPGVAAYDVGVYLRGDGLRVQDDRCRAELRGWSCVLGTVHAPVRLPVTGRAEVGTAHYRRAPGGPIIPRVLE